MKKALFTLLLILTTLSVTAQTKIYSFTAINDEGKAVSLNEYRGKVLLVVNTATRCGFTPQYKELEDIYKKYKDEGLEILDFPCNQFGQQAPGSIQEIHQFCTANFDIQFPQFDKVDVNGPNATPLFTWLKSQKGFEGFGNTEMGKRMDGMMRQRNAEYDKNADIKWNFTKFLVGRDGEVIARFEPTAAMSDVEQAVKKALLCNDVIQTIMGRRSIRKYLDKPVEHDKLEILATCGINAPSGMNRQPWLIRVIENEQWITAVTDIYKKANAEMVKRDPSFKNMFRNAPNVIAVCTPKGESSVDAGMLGENIMLAAHSLGLGTCCLGGPVRFLNSNEQCKPYLQQLDIPEGYAINFMIAVGYPDESPAAKPRDEKKVKYIK